ncbi:MAG: type II secretion system protein GspK [Candidatus Hinthialibacter antarcticus]|nr:type II secretion system protein GspK [Candidatus Hinthialibacter antarcticus]
MNTKSRNERGIVLVITLWVILVLSVVSLSYLRQVNLELKMAGFQRDAAVVDSIAKAGLQQAVILLREDRIKDSAENIQETMFRFMDDDIYLYDGGTEVWADSPELLEDVMFYENGDKAGYYFVKIEDESAKFPINNQKTTIEMIAHLLEMTGVQEKQSQSLAAAIMDWRDADTIPTDTGEQGYGRDGADETSFYNTGRRSRDKDVPSVIMKNSPIDSIDELLLIPGMTPGIIYGTVEPEEQKSQGRGRRQRLRRGEYLGLIHFITIYSDTVNLNTVKQEVLESLLYMPLGEDAEHVAQEWVDYRNGRDNTLYTKDDNVLKTIDNSDLDDVHYTEADGMTEELVTQFGAGIFTIATKAFSVECLAEYEGIEKGYRAIIGRDFVPWDQLPVFGLDTDKIEDLEQVQLQVRMFEPIFDAKQRIQRYL